MSYQSIVDYILKDCFNVCEGRGFYAKFMSSNILSDKADSAH